MIAFARRFACVMGALVSAHAAGAHLSDAFERVPASNASTAQRESALFFRSVFSGSQPHEFRVPAGNLVSLNPRNRQLPPAIYDAEKGSVTPLLGSSTPVEGLHVVRVLELGGYTSRFAAAQAVVREKDRERQAWGYVDSAGRWAIAPRYGHAEAPVNRWARAAIGDPYKTDHVLLDLEKGAVLALPPEYAAQFSPLQPVGRHASLVARLKSEAQGTGTFFLASAVTGRLYPLPAQPSEVEASNPDRVPLADGSVFDAARGTVTKAAPVSGPAAADSELLPGVVWRYLDASQRRVAVRDVRRNRTVARGLATVQPFTSEFFVACERTDPDARVVVARSLEYAWPSVADAKLRCGLMDREGRWRAAPRFQHFYALGQGDLILRGRREWCTLRTQSQAAPACGSTAPPQMLRAGLLLDAETTQRERAPGAVRYGYRDANGAVKIPMQFERATPFHGRIALVTRFGVQGLIDPGGNWLTPPPPDDLMALQVLHLSHGGDRCDPCYGLLDRTGRWVWPPVFWKIVPGPRRGQFWAGGGLDYALAAADGRVRRYVHIDNEEYPGSRAPTLRVLPDRIVASAVNGRWGLTDRARAWLVEPQHQAVEVMSDTRALAQSRRRWGMMSARGAWIVEPQFASLEALNEGLAAACRKENAECAMLDAAGKPLALPGPLKTALPFDARGVAAAQDADERWGYVGRDGQWRIAPKFVFALNYDGDVAIVAQPFAETPESLPMPAYSAPYLVRQISLWEKAGLAVVNVAPETAAPNAKGAQWRWKAKREGGSDRIGLIDTEGNWLVPRARFWTNP